MRGKIYKHVEVNITIAGLMSGKPLVQTPGRTITQVFYVNEKKVLKPANS